MRPLLAAMALLSVGAAEPALGAWSAPQPLPVTSFGTPAVAVNAHGDAAVAWASTGSPAVSPSYRTTIQVWVRGRSGRTTLHKVWSSSTSRSNGIAVALDGRGETTVAWSAQTRTARTSTMRAAHGSARGRWASARVIGHGAGQPRLAVAPGGDVLGTWVDGATMTAWREPGHNFGTATAHKAAAGVPSPRPHAVVPSFDRRGRAYLAGECTAAVTRAAPGSHRFGSPQVLDRGRVGGFTLSLSGDGEGLAAWTGGTGCVKSEDIPGSYGPVRASVLRAGRFGPVTTVADASGPAGWALAAQGGGGSVRWTNLGTRSVADVSAAGAAGPARTLTDPLTALFADGGGDVVLAGADTVAVLSPHPFGGFAVQGGVTVVPVGSGREAPAPNDSGLLATAAPLGRAVALTWRVGAGRQQALSVWMPG